MLLNPWVAAPGFSPSNPIPERPPPTGPASLSRVIHELLCFAQECEAVDETLAELGDEDWGRPGLGTWTIAELSAHLVRGATRIAEYLDLPVDAAEPACDRISYWHFDFDAEAPAVAARAREDAARVEPLELPARFHHGWTVSAQRAEALPPDHLLSTIRGPMRLDEYAATRVVEIVVHHMDLRRALDLPPSPTPAAGRLVMELLEGLLGGSRPRNMGRVRFILAATGRIPSDDPRFPVLR